MKIIDEGSSPRRETIHGIGVAAIFILAGIFILGRNLGWIEHSLYRIVISWQMLLIVIGIFSLIKRQTTTGLILIGVGGFFLLPHLFTTEYYSVRTFWPLVFVLIGVILLVRPRKAWNCCDGHHWNKPAQQGTVNNENGFVTSNNSFSSVKQIVLDPVFKGAMLSNRFGGTVLDLRHTTIEPGETFIDIDCAFGGIEIFVPYNWTVKTAVNSVFSGTEDKRYRHIDLPDTTFKLIVRGNASFSGIEIKS
ncbi:MAG: hypothetical protein CVU13_06530 [Bacteroidetes bacterium HGW-Bacteroidetes-8]|jgi:predicted membrane protein|nr:MAG: hypothetical protein CVU13_06530 [Bacteroidetes bacterium HGW-Bacteroidetes-8]